MNTLTVAPPPDLPRRTSPEPVRQDAGGTGTKTWMVALLIFALGVLLRVYPSAGFTGIGFDEALYRGYVVKLEKAGLEHYPAICALYLEDQRKPETITKLPPTRFLYILCAAAWKRIAFGDAPAADPQAPGFAERDPALISLHRISCLFSVLLLALAGICAWRMLGAQPMLGVLALMSFAPTQIHMGQHALIDGFFAFWATLCLWTLWENLRHPNHAGWVAAHTFAVALMVLTKENAFFVFVALAGLVMINRWARFGKVTPRLVLLSLAGAGLGMAILVALAGGPAAFIEIYRLLVSKASNLRYAIMTGDGPWYRYLIDLMLVSPIVVCLALGGIFTSLRQNRALLYLTAFVVFSYAIMCNIKYAMNLRYATIWDLPLRALAVAQISRLAKPFGSRSVLVSTLLVAGLCAFELRQYQIFFVDFKLYELVTEGLVRAVKILK